jgi:hypothetical protein
MNQRLIFVFYCLLIFIFGIKLLYQYNIFLYLHLRFYV